MSMSRRRPPTGMNDRMSPSRLKPTASATCCEATFSGSIQSSIRCHAELDRRVPAQQAHAARRDAAASSLGGHPVAARAPTGRRIDPVDADRAEQPVCLGVGDNGADVRPGGQPGRRAVLPLARVVLLIRVGNGRVSGDVGVLAGRGDRRQVGVGDQPHPDDAIAEPFDWKLDRPHDRRLNLASRRSVQIERSTYREPRCRGRHPASLVTPVGTRLLLTTELDDDLVGAVTPAADPGAVAPRVLRVDGDRGSPEAVGARALAAERHQRPVDRVLRPVAERPVIGLCGGLEANLDLGPMQEGAVDDPESQLRRARAPGLSQSASTSSAGSGRGRFGSRPGSPPRAAPGRSGPRRAAAVGRRGCPSRPWPSDTRTLP